MHWSAILSVAVAVVAAAPGCQSARPRSSTAASGARLASGINFKQGSSGELLAPGMSLEVALSGVEAGDLLVGWFLEDGAPEELSVVDSMNGAWTRSVSQPFGGGARGGAVLYYKANAMAGDVVITVSSSAAAPLQATVSEYSGVDATSPLDRVATAFGSGATASVGPTGALRADNELVYVAAGFGGAVSPLTAGPGFTLRSSQDTTGEEDSIASSIEGQSGSMGFASSTDWTMIVATFRPASSASCAATTCAAQGATCGSVSDGCGGTLSCGACAPDKVCADTSCVASPGTCTLLTDSNVHDSPPLDKPAYLEAVLDPVFRQKIVRVSGDPGAAVPIVGGTWGAVERHHYSKDQAWNADMSLLLLEYSKPLILDANTYQVLYTYPQIDGVDAAKWHPSDPSKMIYVGDHEIRTLNVRTGVDSQLASFDGYSGFLIGLYEGNLSKDGDRLAIYAKNARGTTVTFAYDIASATKHPDIDISAKSVDWASVSPQGDFIVVFYDDQTTEIYDVEGALLQTWPELGVPDHYDMTVDSDGSEIAVGSARSGAHDGQIIKRRLADGAITALTSGGYGEHSSTRNTLRPGWAYVSFFATASSSLYAGEIAAVKLDGSMTVERIVPFRSTERVYDSGAQPSPSPDGSKVIFASDWGAAGGPIQAYVVEMPGIAAGYCR